jgi:hypothetical protein
MPAMVCKMAERLRRRRLKKLAGKPSELNSGAQDIQSLTEETIGPQANRVHRTIGSQILHRTKVVEIRESDPSRSKNTEIEARRIFAFLFPLFLSWQSFFPKCSRHRCRQLEMAISNLSIELRDHI